MNIHQINGEYVVKLNDCTVAVSPDLKFNLYQFAKTVYTNGAKDVSQYRGLTKTTLQKAIAATISDKKLSELCYTINNGIAKYTAERKYKSLEQQLSQEVVESMQTDNNAAQLHQKIKEYADYVESLLREHVQLGHDYTAEQARAATLQQRITTATDDLRKLTTANDGLKTANEKLKTANEKLKTARDELKTANDELKTANDALTSENDELKNKITRRDDRITRRNNRIKTLQEQFDKAIELCEYYMNFVELACDVYKKYTAELTYEEAKDGSGSVFKRELKDPSVYGDHTEDHIDTEDLSTEQLNQNRDKINDLLKKNTEFEVRRLDLAQVKQFQKELLALINVFLDKMNKTLVDVSGYDIPPEQIKNILTRISKNKTLRDLFIAPGDKKAPIDNILEAITTVGDLKTVTSLVTYINGLDDAQRNTLITIARDITNTDDIKLLCAVCKDLDTKQLKTLLAALNEMKTYGISIKELTEKLNTIGDLKVFLDKLSVIDDLKAFLDKLSVIDDLKADDITKIAAALKDIDNEGIKQLMANKDKLKILPKLDGIAPDDIKSIIKLLPSVPGDNNAAKFKNLKSIISLLKDVDTISVCKQFLSINSDVRNIIISMSTALNADDLVPILTAVSNICKDDKGNLDNAHIAALMKLLTTMSDTHLNADQIASLAECAKYDVKQLEALLRLLNDACNTENPKCNLDTILNQVKTALQYDPKDKEDKPATLLTRLIERLITLCRTDFVYKSFINKLYDNIGFEQDERDDIDNKVAECSKLVKDGIKSNAKERIDKLTTQIVDKIRKHLKTLKPSEIINKYKTILPVYIVDIIKQLIDKTDEESTGDDLLKHLRELHTEPLAENTEYLWKSYDLLKTLFDPSTYEDLDLTKDLNNYYRTDPTKITAELLYTWIEQLQKKIVYPNLAAVKLNDELISDDVIKQIKYYIKELSVPNILLHRIYEININEFEVNYSHGHPDSSDIINATDELNAVILNKFNELNKIPHNDNHLCPSIPEYYINNFHALMRIATLGAKQNNNYKNDDDAAIDKSVTINDKPIRKLNDTMYADASNIIQKNELEKQDVYNLYQILSYLISDMHTISTMIECKKNHITDNATYTIMNQLTTYKSGSTTDGAIAFHHFYEFHRYYMILYNELNIFVQLIVCFINRINNAAVKIDDNSIKMSLNINLKLLLILILIVYTKYLDSILKYNKDKDGKTCKPKSASTSKYAISLEHAVYFNDIIKQFNKKSESAAIARMNEILDSSLNPKNEIDEDMIVLIKKYGVTRTKLNNALSKHKAQTTGGVKTQFMLFNDAGLCLTESKTQPSTHIEKVSYMQPILSIINSIAEIVKYDKPGATNIYIGYVNQDTKDEAFDQFYNKTVKVLKTECKLDYNILITSENIKFKGGFLSKFYSPSRDTVEDLQHKIKIISVILFCVLLIVVIAVISVVVYNLTSEKSYIVKFA